MSAYSVRASNWIYTNQDVNIYSEQISNEYPLIDARRPNRLTNDEKRYVNVFNDLTESIERQFETINKTINRGNSKLENMDW